MDSSIKQPHVVIEPKKGWQIINFKELRDYKDLFQLMVLRDITVQYKQTILGFAWAVITPLFTTFVFSIIFGRLAKIDTGALPYPVFSIVGTVVWSYFSNALNASTNSLITATNIISKVYFPRLIIPLTPIFAKMADFFIGFVLMILFLLYYNFVIGYHINVNWGMMYMLPVLIIMMMMTAAGLGMWLSSMAIQYRDVKFALTFLIMIMQYAAPVVWPASKIHAQYRLVYGIYPMGGIIEGFRSVLLGGPMPWDMIWVGAISATLIFISGAMYFRKMEKIFADVA